MIDDTQKLIQAHWRRLQILKQQYATQGSSAPPQIWMEIQDIQATLTDLINTELTRLSQTRPDAAERPRIEQAMSDYAGYLAQLRAAPPPRVEPPLPPADPTQARRDYLEHVSRTHRRLPLMSLDPQGGRDSGQISLGDVYVGLNADPPLETTWQQQPGHSRSVTAWAAARPRLVILGDPGSGKSTFLKFLAVYLAQGLLDLAGDWQSRLQWPVYPRREADHRPPTAVAGEDEAKPLGQAVWPRPGLPVFITLRDFANSDFNPHSAVAFWPFIESYLQQQQIPHTAPVVQAALRQGQAVLLFDGVDEVPLDRRYKVWQAIGALSAGPWADCPWLATCRKLSYNEDEAGAAHPAAAITLAPLAPPQIESFITAWFGALQQNGDITADQARGWSERLRQAAAGPLSDLAPNPMLLTIMALVQTSRATLPDERVKLYLACVETLLFRWQQHKEEAEADLPLELARLGLKPDAVKGLLAEIAWQAHCGQTVRANEPADIPASKVLELARRHLKDPEKAAYFVTYTELRAHLLIGRGGQNELHFGFPHRTFQEYLAARYLVGLPNFGEEAGRLAESGDYWRTVLLLAAEELVYNHEAVGRNTLLRELPDLLPETDPLPGHTSAWQRVWRAGEMLVLLGPAAAETAKGQKLLYRLRPLLAGLLTGGELTPPERAAAARTLAQLPGGDPRPGLGLTNPPLPQGLSLPISRG